MENLLAAVATVLSPGDLPFLLGGVLIGVVMGAIPGLTGTMAIALLLPLTFYMTAGHAITLLVAIYASSFAGGVVTAILLGIPGEPASIVTTFDGYPMAKKGEAGKALGYAILASGFGGLFSWVVLVTLTFPISEIAVKLRPFDILSLVMMALVLIAALGEGSIFKGIVAGLFGILVSMPGTDPSSGDVRLTFGFHQLDAGFTTLAVLVGTYAVSVVLSDLITIDHKASEQAVHSPNAKIRLSFAEMRGQGWNLIRSSVIGTGIGILPALGGIVGSIISYTVARSTSKTPEKFGTGFPDGVVASECGATATVGGALVPLIALGIPGSVTDVFLLAALVIQGMQPGPLLFSQHPEIVYIFFASMLTATIVLVIVLLVGIPYIVKILSVPLQYLFPIILMFCVTAAFADNNRVFDVFVMLAFGIVGLVMTKSGFSLGAFVIGFVLGPIGERSLRAGLTLSDGSYWDIFLHPVSATCMLLSAIIFVWSLRSQQRINQRLAGFAKDAE
jgi:putative tricarboxylic transport membrane protein